MEPVVRGWTKWTMVKGGHFKRSPQPESMAACPLDEEHVRLVLCGLRDYRQWMLRHGGSLRIVFHCPGSNGNGYA